jgi:hypothetical protein
MDSEGDSAPGVCDFLAVECAEVCKASGLEDVFACCRDGWVELTAVCGVVRFVLTGHCRAGGCG